MSTKNNTKVSSMVDFSILSGISNVGTKKESIYKLSIFEGKTEKERKALRKKLRNSRDNVILAFNQANETEKKNIKEKWLQYAKGVYKDINIIFELNTTEDSRNLCTKFLIDLQKIK